MSENLQGQLLIASPSLTNSPFTKTVVLIMQQNESGTFGAVLNRRADKSLRQVWDTVTGSSRFNSESFCVGGPMGGPVYALHRSKFLSELSVSPELFVSAEVQKLSQLARQNRDPYRIFLGLSGWRVGQLESEINRGVWFHTPVDLEQVFGETEYLWEFSLRRYGRQVLCDLLKRSELYGSPEQN